MNRIGMRAIKSGLAIVLCYLFYIILASIDKFVFEERILSKWFIPFMAGMVGFFSVSNTKKNLLKNSGHLWLLYILVFLYAFAIMGLYVGITQKPWPDLEALEPIDLIAPSILVCVGVVFLGYLMLIFNEKDKIVNGIVLYLIIVSVKFYNSNLLESFIGGISSITFGVFIGLMVNVFPIYFKTYDKFLFIYCTDGIYHHDDVRFDYYVNYEIQDLIRKGADITLFTNRTPSALIPLIGDLKLDLPVICMSGAALYDTNTNHYLKTNGIEEGLANEIREFLEARQINPFISVIKDNLQYIYKDKNDNIAELRYGDIKRNNPFSNYIAEKAPNTEVLFFTVILKTKEIDDLISEFKKANLAKNLYFKLYQADKILDDLAEYTILNIYSSAIEEFNILDSFNSNKIKMAISTSMDDLVLLNKADKIVTYKKAPTEIKNKADYIIKSNRKHALVRVMKRFYYRKSSY